MKTALLIAAMPAAASAFSLRPAAGPFSSTPSLEQTVYFGSQSPPKHSSHHRGRRGTRLMLFKRNRPNKYQLQASTVSPDDHRNSNPWFDFVNLRDSVADYADSLFSLEGGPVAAAATRPYMPNLEVEEQLLTSASTTNTEATSASSSSSVTELDKGELLMELNTLSDSFDELQSTFEVTLSNLQDENSFLEEGIKMLTATIDEQAAQIEQLQKQQTLGEIVGEEPDDLDGIGAIFENKVVADDTELAEVQNKAETLEKDNEMLRQRVRALEVELSDIAFESRKIVSSAAAVEDAAAAVMEAVAPTISEVNADAVVEDIVAAPSEEVTVGAVIEETNAASEVNLSPHAPSTPIPQHILQQKEIDYLRMQVREYEAERKSVRKLFGRGIRRGAKKVGKVLDLWKPIYLILWGEIRGDGKMAL